MRMSFAGIAYKTDDPDAQHLEAKVRPLVDSFAAAETKVRVLDPPASLREVHDRYLEAVTLYENASALTVKAAEEGRDEMLVDAQGMSFRAAEDCSRSATCCGRENTSRTEFLRRPGRGPGLGGWTKASRRQSAKGG